MILFISILHVLLCLALVAIVLIQHGKGADMGVALGGGGSQTLFGARGAGNFMTKITSGAAALFMVTSLSLSYIGSQRGAADLLQEAAPAESPTGPAPEASTPSAGEGSEEAAPAAEPEDAQAPAGFEAIPAPEGAPAEEAD